MGDPKVADLIENWDTPNGVTALRSMLAHPFTEPEHRKKVKAILRGIGLKRARDAWKREAADERHNADVMQSTRDTALAALAEARECMRSVDSYYGHVIDSDLRSLLRKCVEG